MIKAGALCVVAYVVLQIVISPIVWTLVTDISVPVSVFVNQIPSAIAYSAIAFGLGAGGFLLRARVIKPAS
jgi:hypothetical protein